MLNTLSLYFPFSLISLRMLPWLGRTLVFKIALVILSIGVVVLLGLYLLQVGDLMAKSFALQNSEANMEGLSRDNGGLKVERANRLSFRDLEQRISQLNFVTVEQVRYIPIYSKQLVSNVK